MCRRGGYPVRMTVAGNQATLVSGQSWSGDSSHIEFRSASLTLTAHNTLEATYVRVEQESAPAQTCTTTVHARYTRLDP